MSRTKTFVRNVSTVLATQLIVWGLGWAVNIFVPGYLGDARLGQLQQAEAYAGLFTIFVPLGMTALLAREISRNPERLGELLGATLVARLGLGAVAILLTISILPLLGTSPAVFPLTLVLVATALIIILGESFSAALLGLERAGRGSLGALAERVLYSCLALAVVFLKLPLIAFGVIGAISATVSIGVNVVALRGVLPRLRMPNRELLILLTIGSLPFFASGFLRGLRMHADKVVLGQFASDAATGWYGIGWRFLGMAAVIPAALCAVLMPTLVRLHTENPSRFADVLDRVAGLVTLIGAPIAMAMVFAPDRILFDLLPYPRSEFANSAPVVSIFGFGLLFLYLTMFYGTVMNSIGLERRMIPIFLGALVVAVPSLLLLVPFCHKQFGNGAIGAALVNVLVEGYVLVAMLFAMPREYLTWQTALRVFPPLLAALPLGLLLRFAPEGRYWAYAAAAMGGLLFPVLCFALRGVRREDIDLLREGLSARQAS